jgi:hypothetical protein
MKHSTRARISEAFGELTGEPHPSLQSTVITGLRRRASEGERRLSPVARWIAFTTATLFVVAIVAGYAIWNKHLLVSPAPATRTGQTGSIWDNGVSLPAGHRAVLVADGVGWVVTQPFQDNSLVLTKFSLATGSPLRTSVLDTGVQGFSGAGLASDGGGHVWITYGQRILRFDELTGTVTSWHVPKASPRLSTDQQLAGNAQVDGWDSKNNQLLFVRNDDQRLYSFNPSTQAFAVVSELPITTSDISTIAIEPTGEMAITGTLAGASTFTPTAARLATLGAKPEVIAGVAAVCAGSSRLVFLAATGTISVDGTGDLATVPAPRSTQVPFACDTAGGVFEVTVGGGKAVVSRLSPSGVIATVSAPLIPGVANGLNGPVSTFADPGVVALLPDNQGNVWLVSEAGTQVVESRNVAAAYPSLAHAVFTQ